MDKKKKHILGRILAFFIICGTISILSLGFVFLKTTASAHLDETKLASSNLANSIRVYDKNDELMDTSLMFKNSYIAIDSLPSYVKNAFVAVEDRRFYEHNGVDIKRMAGAALKNIKNRKFKEGASTISQQLIKNTHLSREKTIERKFKEIKLARNLEKKYNKDQILEMYLNTIYFGNGCYGIEKAAKFYFDKSASELSINEAALLASVINAPSVYDPITKSQRANERKDLVLLLMKSQGYISEEEYSKNAKQQINIVKTASKTANQELKTILVEACNILKVNENQLKNMNVNVYTSIDTTLQNTLKSLVTSNSFVPKNAKGETPACGVIVIDNKTKSVTGFASNSRSNLLSIKRQPGSTIKPIIVYAPSFEKGLLYPESIIVDEKINIEGYSPSNSNKTFSGPVSVRHAVERSLNIPAVKALSHIGINNAKEFASRLGFEFANNDQNLALALGGMTEGVTIKTLADAYSAFATGGKYAQSHIINKITLDNGRELYKSKTNLTPAMSEETAYLMTDVLKGVAKNGTAKRLSGFKFDVASKTGTVGASSSNKNTDAFNVAYTADHTIVSWIGASRPDELLESSVNGATYPVVITKNVLETLYEDYLPESFSKPQNVQLVDIDTRSLEENKIELANEFTSLKFRKQALFDMAYLPRQSSYSEAHKPELEISMEEGMKPTLSFNGKPSNIYDIYRLNVKENKLEKISGIEGVNSVLTYTDNSASRGTLYEYYILSSLKDGSSQNKSNSIKLMSY